MNANEQSPSKGFAILIKAPGVKRNFVPRQGETITITDKDGRELWSFKDPVGRDNPGVIIHTVHIDLLTEREFARFVQGTWIHKPAAPPDTDAPATNNPS